jgi:prevent-host-death family protein
VQTSNEENVMSTVPFRNRDGKLVDVPMVTASRLKNEFGTVFEQAAVGGAVVITKHDTPRAVLLSYAEFEALTASAMHPGGTGCGRGDGGAHRAAAVSRRGPWPAP